MTVDPITSVALMSPATYVALLGPDALVGLEVRDAMLDDRSVLGEVWSVDRHGRATIFGLCPDRFGRLDEDLFSVDVSALAWTPTGALEADLRLVEARA